MNHKTTNNISKFPHWYFFMLFHKILFPPAMVVAAFYLRHGEHLRRNIEDEAEITFGEIRSERMASGDPGTGGYGRSWVRGQLKVKVKEFPLNKIWVFPRIGVSQKGWFISWKTLLKPIFWVDTHMMTYTKSPFLPQESDTLG